MKPVLLLLLAGFATTAVACSPSSTRWVKAGTTPEDFQLDQDQCASRSEDYNFAFDDRDTRSPGAIEGGVDNPIGRVGSARGDVYRDCMEARGWRRERGGQTPR